MALDVAYGFDERPGAPRAPRGGPLLHLQRRTTYEGVALCGAPVGPRQTWEVTRDRLPETCYVCALTLATKRSTKIKRPPRPRIVSQWEILLDQEIARAGLPEPRKEYRFFEEHGRRWAFDRAWLHDLVAVEVDGGHWMKGAKAHGGGFALEDEAVKYACAALLGWRVFRVTPNLIKQGYAVRWIARALGAASLPVNWSLLAPTPSELRPKAVRGARVR